MSRLLFFDQWILPVGQNKLRVRINRNNTSFTVGAAQTIQLDNVSQPQMNALITSIGKIKEEVNDEDGYLTCAQVPIGLKDSFYLSGVSNGSPVVYDFGNPTFLGTWNSGTSYVVDDVVSFNDEQYKCVTPVVGGSDPKNAAWEPYYGSVLNTIFRDNAYYESGNALYSVWIERLKNDGVTYEIIFAGDINPDTIPILHNAISDPTSASEQQFQQFTVQCDAGSTRMKNKKLQPMVDILYTYPSGAKDLDGSDLSNLPEPNRFTQSDMGPWAPFYAGLIPEDIIWHTGAPYPTFNQPNEGNPAPFFDHYIYGASASDQYIDIAAFGRFDGQIQLRATNPAGNANFDSSKGDLAYAINNWPENTWAINLQTLLEKLYAYCGFDTTASLTSPFELGYALWDTTNFCYAPTPAFGGGGLNIPASPGPYFCYNFLFGVSPEQRFNAGANLPLWRGGITYDLGARVADGSNGLSYVSIQAGNFSNPPNSSPAWWTETSDAGTPYPPTWSALATYHQGQEVIYASQIWFSNVDNNTAGPPGTILGWTAGNDTGAPLGNWSSTFTYNKGDEVIYKDRSWSSSIDANLNNIPGADPAIWALNEDTGSQFSSPVSFAWNQSVSDVLKATCLFFGCYMRTEIDQVTGKLKVFITSRTEQAGTLPTNFTLLTGSNEQPRKLSKDYIEIKNAGSDLAMRCPPAWQGDAQQVQLQWRLKRWGETIANPGGNGDTGKTFPLADMMFSSPLYNSAEFTKQGNYCRRHDGTQPNRLASQGWVLGAHLFQYYAGPGWSNQTGYPGTIGNGDIAARNGFEGYYALYGMTEHTSSHFYGTNPGFTSDRLNNFYAPAQLYHNEWIGKKSVLVREYDGIADDTDNWFGVRLGMEMQTQIRGKYRTYKAISIERDPTDYTTRVEWIEKLDPNDALNETPAEFFQGDNAVGNVSSGGGSSSSGSSTSSSSSNLYFTDLHRTMHRTVKFYHAGSVSKTMDMTTIETYDVANARWVVQRGWPQPYEATTGSTYGFNSEFFFHYKGTEHGNAEVVGISPAGTPDYQAPFLTSFKKDIAGDNSNINYGMEFGYWSEDKNDWIIQRPPEKSNTNRRLLVHGRFKQTWNAIAHHWNVPTWVTLADTLYPMSNQELQFDADLANGTATLPGFTVVGNTGIQITWGSRFKPVSISASTCYRSVSIPPPTEKYQLFVQPVINQIPNANSITVLYSLDDFTVTGGTNLVYNPDMPTALADLAMPSTGFIVYTDILGYIEIIGENATVF